MVHPEAEVNIQPLTALTTLAPRPEGLVLGGTHTTLRSISLLCLVLATSHFQPTGQSGWCFM